MAPLTICLNLAVIPVAPLLYVVLGTRLSESEHGNHPLRISRSWPVYPGIRTTGQALTVLAISLMSALVTFLCSLWQVPTGFWSNSAWLLYTARDGIGILFVNTLFMLSFGYLWGQWLFSIWKSVIALLILLIVGLATVVAVQAGFLTGWFSGWVALYQWTPFSWLTDTLSPVWGFGPFARDLSLLVGWVVLLTLAWWIVAWAGISRTRWSETLAGLGVFTMLALSFPLAKSLWHQTQGITQNQVISWAHQGPKGPVAITASHLSLDIGHGTWLKGHGVFHVTSQRPVPRLPLFLNPELHITRITVNQHPVIWHMAHQRGWIWIDHPLHQGQTLRLTVVWAGRFLLLGEYPNTITAFSSTQGAILPAATWYPLTANPKRQAWQVDIHAPRDLVVVSGYGFVNKSDSVKGNGPSMELVLGHLTRIPYKGPVIYASSDQTALIHHVLHRSTALNRLMRNLGPPYFGSLVWNGAMEWEPPFVSLSRAPWPSVNSDLSYPAYPGIGTALSDNTINQPILQTASGLPRHLLNLWLTEGRGGIQDNSVTHHLVSAMLARYVLAGNYRLGPLIEQVGKLSPAGFHWSAVQFRHLLKRAPLTRIQINHVLEQAQVRYPEKG
ncbi:hypothetical protein CO251_02575 [Sulfobacillus sp. hq2]|nr:hypothetical protein CO251_02575 [Sulfobacillus sp. hq2]